MSVASPTITISSPANHTKVWATSSFAVTAKDALSGVAQVKFYVDGRLVSATTAPYAFRWQTAKVAKTAHTLTAKAIDRASNSTLKSISVKVA